MKILREYLGGREVIDLDDPDQRAEFVNGVVQDDETAEAWIAEIERDGWMTVNANEAEFIERYTRLEGDGVQFQNVPLEDLIDVFDRNTDNDGWDIGILEEIVDTLIIPRGGRVIDIEDLPDDEDES